MAGTLKRIFIENWHKKLLSILLAFCIWLIIDCSITVTRNFTKVPVRVVNIPFDKTIRGLQPNGILDKQLALTLTGTKDVLEKIEPGDFEVVIDASHKGDEWIVKIGKKNLVSLNPDLDLMHHVTALSHSSMPIRLSKLLTDKIPIHTRPPKGEPPEGYQFLDVWPHKLMHVVSGPEEDVRQLQAKGIDLTFDLSQITTEDLDRLTASGPSKDEVSFPIPDTWKQVEIPFLPSSKQEINGPEARHLRLDFLRKKLLPLESKLPIEVFYSLPVSNKINPQNHPLQPNDWIIDHHGILVVDKKLYVEGVSQLFLDIVKDHLVFVISVFDQDVKESLPTSVQFIDSKQLEDRYVTLVMGSELDPLKERYLRERFRQYKRTLQLYTEAHEPFVLKPYLEERAISVKIK